MSDSEAHGPADPAAGRTPARRGRVLLVDDDPPVARALTRMMELLGYEVTEAADGARALSLFRSDPARFDVVVTDETLPGLRGHELTRALLALRPGLPVLICTGYVQEEEEDRARRVGARALLTKPLDLAQLAQALRDALGG